MLDLASLAADLATLITSRIPDHSDPPAVSQDESRSQYIPCRRYTDSLRGGGVWLETLVGS